METLAAARPQKVAEPDHEILDLFAERWSPRAFADRPVEPEKIRRMLEAARLCSSRVQCTLWRRRLTKPLHVSDFPITFAFSSA